VTDVDRQVVGAALERWRIEPPTNGFRKLIAGRRLWNFQKSDRDLWKSAL
jgi:hypothetical protein